MPVTLERALHLLKYRIVYQDARGQYRWSSKAALPPGARAGHIATPYDAHLRAHFARKNNSRQLALFG